MWSELKELWKKDNLLNEAWDMTYEAIDIDAEMFKDGVETLWGGNRQAVQKLIFKKDKLINKYERDIRRKVITHLAVQGNISITAGLVLSTVIIDVERIGDYVKNIVDLADMHPEPLKGDEFTEKLHNIEATINEMFTGAHICLENGDEAVALDLYAKTKEIGRTCDAFIERIIKSEQDVGLTCKNLAVFALYFRYLKRINAHLRNIVSSVINPFDRIGYKPKQS
jgi:phosphate uptake regulator